MIFDYMVVGSGFFGAICAKHLHDQGKSVVVVEKRNHIGGNCYTEQRDGINIHVYGPHIFHTNNPTVWAWINQFAEFKPFRLQVMATAKGRVYSLPFSMHTFEKVYNATTPKEAIDCIANDCEGIGDAENLETSAIKKVGRKVYELLIKGYTEKQWMRDAETLPASIVNRLPVRFTYDTNYFNDTFQGIPVGGYTQIFEKLLDGIPVMLETDFFTSPLPEYKNLIYTGPIDKFFGYKHGHLEYKTVVHQHRYYPSENVQGCPVMNYCDKDVPYTRIIEHKHFEESQSEGSWISTEFPVPYIVEQTDPYYPVNDNRNNAIYEAYKDLARSLPNVYFGGRLAEYKYYDMHQVIDSALKFCKESLTYPNLYNSNNQ
jgi:UDP-galactopyranose mutase